jgi:hypothetical protein
MLRLSNYFQKTVVCHQEETTTILIRKNMQKIISLCLPSVSEIITTNYNNLQIEVMIIVILT